ncbi:MAG: hypothetical protein KIT20_05035 [Alphaproteobacteria bacterium]|nr:hypothetical protein [Alphaproteobacteria bacterium]
MMRANADLTRIAVTLLHHAHDRRASVATAQPALVAKDGEAAPYGRWQRHFEAVWARNSRLKEAGGGEQPEGGAAMMTLRRAG